MLGLEEPTEGDVVVDGIYLDSLAPEELRKMRDEGTIDFEERRSRMLWWLKIYRIRFEGEPSHVQPRQGRPQSLAK